MKLMKGIMSDGVALSSHRHFVEIVLILGAIAGIDALGLLPVRLANIQPHPFWIPILLSAALYGRLLGVVTVALATVLDASLNWPSLASQTDLYSYLVEVSQNPILWLLAVSVLGGIREKHLQHFRDSEAVKQQRTAEAQTLAQRCQVLGREVALLEHRIAASGASAAGATLQTLDRLLELPLPRAFDGFAQALQRLVGAKGVSVYLPYQGHWVSVTGAASADGDNSDGHADEAAANICRQVASAGRVLSCFRQADASILGARAAMATAFVASDSQFVCVVLVREVDPACLTPAGEAALSLTSFIFGSRAVLDGTHELESLAVKQLRYTQSPKLRIVNDSTQ